MTRIVPPIPGATYTLVSDDGMVLTDPSGVVASWSIVAGVLEVTTNAVIGTAYLLRPIVPIEPRVLHTTSVRARRVIQATTRLQLLWGEGGDPATVVNEFNSVGISLEPSAVTDRPITNTQNVTSFAETCVQDLYTKGVIVTGAPSGNTATTQASVACGGVRFGSVDESATHRTTSGAPVFPLTTEGFKIINSSATAQTASAEFATNTVVQDYETPGNTAPVLSAASSLQPIGPLTASLGWVLNDPSGIIASAPVSNGSEITVGFNAIAGVAFLTRPLTTDNTEVVLFMQDMDVAVPPATAILNVSHGFSDATGATHRTNGVKAEPGTRRTVVRTNGTNFSNGFDAYGGSRYNGSITRNGNPAGITDRYSAHLSTFRAVGNTTRAIGSDFSEEESTHECLCFETDGAAAETLIWDALVSITQPLRY